MEGHGFRKKHKQTDERDTGLPFVLLKKKRTNLEKMLFQAFSETNKNFLFQERDCLSSEAEQRLEEAMPSIIPN